jgi:hypothetical protein
LINPLYPPVLGDFFITGGYPQTPGRKYPAPLSQRSPIKKYLSDSLTPTEQNFIGYLVDRDQYEIIELLPSDLNVPYCKRYVQTI